MHSNNGDASLSLTFSRLHFFLFLTRLSSVVSEFFFSLQILIFFRFSLSHFLNFSRPPFYFLLLCYFLSHFLNENRSFPLLSSPIVFIFFYIFFYHLSILGLFFTLSSLLAFPYRIIGLCSCIRHAHLPSHHYQDK